MKEINYLKNNIINKNITVLGEGVSGQGASILANYLIDEFLSGGPWGKLWSMSI